ncbi:MAG: flagellar hook-basal body complex protein [Planctomycetota bacterium]
MPLTTALFTGLTGMQTNSQLLDVTGNNIANVNTTAFKRSIVQFETQISQTLKDGSQPSGTLGGTNPSQVGLGTRLAAIRRDFSDGALQTTGVATDLAVEGNGFFIVNDAGRQRFSRDGGFNLDRNFNLVNNSGGLIQGYGVDDNFNVVDGVLQDLNIPVGVLTIAEPTTEVNFSGNLNAGGDVATQGSIVQTQSLYATAAGSAGAFVTAATDLSSVFDASGANLLALGDVVTISGAAKGGATLPDKTFTISATDPGDGSSFGTTVQDLLTFYEDIFGIDTATSGGGVVDASGRITLTGNEGFDSRLELPNGSFVVNESTAPAIPFQFTETQEANGESARTSFLVFDSLGNPLTIDLTLTLISKADEGTTWRFTAQSEDDTDLARQLTTGEINFDNEGQFLAVTNNQIRVDRDQTGAVDPLNFSMAFEDRFGSVTALADVVSQINAFSQDGTQLGTLEDFTTSEDGTISGVFSNGLIRDLGRIPLATFSNPEGLLELGGNSYRPTPNSGDAVIVQAGTGGSGRIIGGALELSNVELSEEFISLINASTGFSANSRIITTAQQLIQELLASVR